MGLVLFFVRFLLKEKRKSYIIMNYDVWLWQIWIQIILIGGFYESDWE